MLKLKNKENMFRNRLC